MSGTGRRPRDGQPLNIVVIVGNPKRASRTLTVAKAVADKLLEELAGDAGRSEVIDLAEYADELLDFGSVKVTGLVEAMMEADLLVVGSPTYKATYTGILKVFLDRIGGGSLGGKIAVPVMVAGAPQHALAVEAYLRPLLIELGATCPTPGLCMLESQINDLGGVIRTWWSNVSPSLSRLQVTTG